MKTYLTSGGALVKAIYIRLKDSVHTLLKEYMARRTTTQNFELNCIIEDAILRSGFGMSEAYKRAVKKESKEVTEKMFGKLTPTELESLKASLFGKGGCDGSSDE